MESTSQTNIKVGLHPLAIAAICDHATRVSVGGTKQNSMIPALGLLFGTEKSATEYEIVDAIDLFNNITTKTLPIIEIERKNRLLTEVYPKYKLLGWYITGSEVVSDHMLMHRSLFTLCSNPLFLLVNPFSSSTDLTQLPIVIFTMKSVSSTISTPGHNSNANPNTSPNATDVFIEVAYVLATNKAEEISIDSITKHSNTQSTGISKLELYTQGMGTSLSVLEEHIDILLQGCRQMNNDTGVIDHQLLRMAGQLSNQLANIGKEGEQLDNTENEVTAYLGVSTKALVDLYQLIDVTSVICQDKALL